MDRARLDRRQRKGALTRIMGGIQRLIAQGDTQGVESKLEQVLQAFNTFEAAHDVYTGFLEEEKDIDESDNWYSDVEQTYIGGVKSAREWLHNASVKSSGATASIVSQTDLMSLLTIPKVELDTFSGDSLEYQSFIAIFDECVGNNSVEDQVKLTRLLQYTSGAAKAAIRNCALVGGSDGYQQARKILQSRFGNKHLVSSKIISGLKSGKSVNKSVELQQLADDLTMASTSLSKLGMLGEVDNQRTILDIVLRCPRFVQNKWRKLALDLKRDSECYPEFTRFVSFMNDIARNACDPVYGSDNFSSKQTSKSVTCSNTTCHNDPQVEGTHSVHSNPRKPADSGHGSCVVCKQPHRLFQCDRFKSLPPKERLQVVIDNRLCFNCLLAGHFTRECRKQSVCTVPGCGRRHTKFIHVDDIPSRGNNGNGQGTFEASNASANTFGSAVYLPIVPVIVNGRIRAHALLDSGSTNTFISKSLSTRLGLDGTQISYRMSTLCKQSEMSSRVVEMSLSPEGTGTGDGMVLKNVLVVDDIPAKYPRQVIDISKYSHLADLPITTEGKVEILIGMDNAQLIMPIDVRSSPDNQLYATKTRFGWSLNGPVEGATSSEVCSHFVNIEQQVENLWRMDSIDDDDRLAMSREDQKVIDLWDQEVELVDGHYTLPIPWREGRPSFPNNKHSAMHRLSSLKKKLDRTDMYEKYSQSVQKFIDCGYAERVPEEELQVSDGSVWFLPHHGVVNEAKPGKIRVVFDCAATQNGISLNNQCHQGPDLNNKLISVLLKFRLYSYALTADVEAMYMQVKIPDKDRNSLRFLWYDNGSITQYRMTSHLFGGVWCASSSTYALRRTLEDCLTSDLIRDTILKSFYVDDLLKSLMSIPEVRQVIYGSKEVLAHGGFNLVQFVVNVAAVLEEIPQSDRATAVKEIMPEMSSKALGIKWEVCEDTFYYVSKTVSYTGKVTRRIMLSQVASMYDPLGCIGPIVHLGKVLFQEATRMRLPWDEPVSISLSQRWISWLSSLGELSRLKFSRCLIPEAFVDGVAELHHFCDASQVGYGACSYMRVINRSGKIRVTLLISKGRLVPLKSVTIPRLELASAVVAVKLETLLRRELDIPLIASTFWTDSEIVLAYIRSETRRFKVFVANRVSIIRQSSTPDQWHHISGDCNPADILSRGCVVESLPESWVSGPPMLMDYKGKWPSDRSVSSEISLDDPEVCKSVDVAVCVETDASAHPLELLSQHYSSYYRLRKAVSWLLRVKRYLQHSTKVSGPVTVPELREADKVLIRYVQAEAYHKEVASLSQTNQVSRSSRLCKLMPALQDGIIVVGGRLKHSPMSAQAKHPAILPAGHHVSRMIVREIHDEAHLGTEWTLSKLRQRYWIVNARSMLKYAKRMCVVCKRLYAAPGTQQMADLPPERCQAGLPPFTYVGVDLCGTFYVKVGRANAKRYVCVFTCFTTRAIHMEVLNSLESDAFINGMARFIARRGAPRKMWSDNGTNIVGAQAEMSRSLRQLDRHKVTLAARRRDIEWSFNPPLASHQGGVWERMIRTFRRILVALLSPNDRLNDDILHTVVCEIENLINSRPITKVSDDVSDGEALTPNHLLLIRGNASLPWGTFVAADVYRKHWKHVQYITSQFWRRWIREYLPELQKRPKWLGVVRNVQIGDLVLIMDENAPRGAWPLGLVLETTSGRDGLVRSAKLRTKSTVLVRPITKLVLLEGCDMFNVP